MKINIRSKLVIAISLLMVVLFAMVALLFINEKRTEIAEDIYVNALAYSKLTAPIIVDDYDLYLAESGFVYFNREINSFFEQNADIAAIKVITYSGELLYDSIQDVDRRYEGPLREISDEDLLEQIHSEHISIKTQDEQSSRTLFISDDFSCVTDKDICTQYGIPEGGIVYVDNNEKVIQPLQPGTLVDYLVVPASEKYSVVYYLDYQSLIDRVAVMVRRIVYLAIFGVMLGMLMSFFLSKKITDPVAKLVGGVEKIAKGDFKAARVNIKTKDELQFLGESFNKMAVDLEESVEAKVYKERVTRELELATEIQNQIIPKNIPTFPGIDLDAGLIPAEEIGGDMYDFLKVNEDKLLMYLGDVTGHGVPAGIVSSIANALFFGFYENPDLKKMMVDVNRVMYEKTVKTMFMTLSLMEWDNAQSVFKFVSAGHEQLIHYRAREGKTVLAPKGGIALGMIGDISKIIDEQIIDFQPGDFIIVYSDGIPEAWRSESEQYGMERFLQVVQNNGVLKTSSEMKAAILNDLNTFTAGYKQMDDITLVVVKRV